MAPIYHFTHADNLAGIIRDGAVRCHSGARCVEDIGDPQIKRIRASKPVPVEPGGVVGDYVPFYYATRSPMLYRLTREGLDQTQIVYLRSSTEAVTGAGLTAVVTDGNAAAYLTAFVPPSQLDAIVDWEIMRAKIWRNTDEDGDRMRRRMAEFLVHGELPLDLIDEVAAVDDGVLQRARTALATTSDIPCVVRRDWYFHEYL